MCVLMCVWCVFWCVFGVCNVFDVIVDHPIIRSSELKPQQPPVTPPTAGYTISSVDQAELWYFPAPGSLFDKAYFTDMITPTTCADPRNGTYQLCHHYDCPQVKAVMILVDCVAYSYGCHFFVVVVWLCLPAPVNKKKKRLFIIIKIT